MSKINKMLKKAAAKKNAAAKKGSLKNSTTPAKGFSSGLVAKGMELIGKKVEVDNNVIKEVGNDSFETYFRSNKFVRKIDRAGHKVVVSFKNRVAAEDFYIKLVAIRSQKHGTPLSAAAPQPSSLMTSVSHKGGGSFGGFLNTGMGLIANRQANKQKQAEMEHEAELARLNASAQQTTAMANAMAAMAQDNEEDDGKGKVGLYVGIGAAVLVVAVLVIVMAKKK